MGEVCLASDSSDQSGAAAGPLIPPRRLLLITDDPEERSLIRRLLDEAVRLNMPLGEFSLDMAGDYRQAVMLARDVGYVAVLLGRVAPAQDGIALLHRAADGRDLAGPFVVLAERADAPTFQAAIAAGAVDLLDSSDLTVVLLDRAVRYALSLHDTQSRIADLQLSDPATGLARHPLFWEVLELALRRAKRNKDYLAVLVLHLDCLEEPTGKPGLDPLQVVVPLIAQRVRKILRASDTIARLDSGHLAILVESMKRPADVQTVAEKVIAALTGRYECAGRIFSAIANVGIALYPTTAEDAGGLLSAAAAATLTAREKGVDTFHFG